MNRRKGHKTIRAGRQPINTAHHRRNDQLNRGRRSIMS
jgi:hypothetical protein